MTNASTTNAACQTPPIRASQLGGGSSSDPASTVNMFRGDANLSETLFTLPGRRQDSGLEVTIAIQYQSNVARDADTWNRDAPTGVLGLGWELPLTWIEAESSGSAVDAQRSYTFYDRGTPNSLIRQPSKQALLRMDPQLAEQLCEGQALPEPLRAALTSGGVALSEHTRVEGSGPWTLWDDHGQRSYELEGGEQLSLYEGGELYQMQNHKFAKVIYYPRYELWCVVSSSGLTRELGGLSKPGDDAASVGNSIVWSVWWTGESGAPTWSGPSSELTGQVRVASAWYLSGALDRYGDRIRLSYTCVDQQVGAGGLSYTKAIYLAEILDVLGRRVKFRYGDKLWAEGEDAAREYADPHRAVPSDTPGPYQDRYETKYLAEIAVLSASGRPMLGTEFRYVPRPEVEGPERALASVSQDPNTAWGDTCKRFLTEVIQTGPRGPSQPSLRFAYHLDDSKPGPQPGALYSRTDPAGAVSCYAYSPIVLGAANRTATVGAPTSVQGVGTPRVFHGPGYEVLTFYNQSQGELSLQVFTWTGTWIEWRPWDDALLDSGGMYTLDSLEVLALEDVLVLSFEREVEGSIEHLVYVFQRDTAQPGQWQGACIDAQQTSPNHPTLSYSGTQYWSLSGGATFFVVRYMDSNNPSLNGYDRVTWRWSTRSWTRKSISTNGCYAWLVAGAEYYALAYDDDEGEGQLELHYLDGLLEWQLAGTTHIPDLWSDDPLEVVMVPGAAMIAISDCHARDANSQSYVLSLLSWDANYQTKLSQWSLTDDYDPQAQLGWTPQIVEDTLVGCNGNVLRRSGDVWSLDQTLNPGQSLDSGTAQYYAYGPDYALRVLAPPQQAASALALAYDPTQDPAWTHHTPSAQLPYAPLAGPNTPSSGGSDWALIGPCVYYRASNTDWSAVFAQAPLLDLSDSEGGKTYISESLVDEAPNFLTYSASVNSSSSVLETRMIHNGQLSAQPTPFDNQSMVLASRARSGTIPGGDASFVSYPSEDSSFDDANTVYLHRYAADDLDGTITHYAVTQVSVSDGFGQTASTAFGPESSTASIDPSGTIAKFYRNLSYPGADSPDNASNGYTENLYLNGAAQRTGADYWDMLDGLLESTAVYTAAGGEPVYSSVTQWQAFDEVASTPQDDQPRLPLHGAWVVAAQTTTVRDGLRATVVSTYDMFTGQPATQTQTQPDAKGLVETYTRTTTYAVRHYPALVTAHALHAVAQTQASWSCGERSAVLTSSATTYALVPLGPRATQLPVPEASFSFESGSAADFPFASYTPGDTPQGWQLQSRTTQWTAQGDVRETVDALGVPSASIYAKGGGLALAQLSNAPADGCAYLGFQSYEDDSGWTLSGVRYDPNCAYTGVRSACLPANQDASVSVSISVAPGPAQTYVIGCRYRTAPGVDKPAGTLTLSAVDSASGETVASNSSAWPATEGAFDYISLPIDLPASQAALTLQVVADNGKDELHLDSVLVAPLVSTTSATTYEADWQLQLASIDGAGRTQKTAYDSDQSPQISVGTNGQITEVQLSAASRGLRGDFDPSAPNCALTLQPATGGILDDFRSQDWRTRWTPDGDAWIAEHGTLVHRSEAAGTLTWTGEAATGTWALGFELLSASEASVSIGDVSVGWSKGTWQGSQAGAPWGTLANPPLPSRHWLVVVGEQVVLFFVGGRLVFSEPTSPAAGPLTITLGAGGLRNLARVEQVRLGLVYSDANGRKRQAQQLHGSHADISQVIYDSLGNMVATTKAAPSNFGGQQATLVYRDSFVEVGPFLDQLDVTGRMQGDVSDYWAGQVEDGIQRSNDGGYPYWGTRYEASGRSMRLESGRPGSHFAINPQVPANERHTVRLALGANTGAEGLPAGQFSAVQITDALGSVSTHFANRFGQSVGTRFVAADGSLQSRDLTARAFESEDPGPRALREELLPNAFAADTKATAEQLSRATVCDANQHALETRDVDAGRTQMIYDSAGRLRFIQPAEVGGGQAFNYVKYDAIGRQLELGSQSGAWDRDSLSAHADDPSYPSTGQASVVIEYDGDGSDPSLIGMKWRTTSTNPEPTAAPGTGVCTVVETFGYDASGNITSVEQSLSGAADLSATIAYAYNAQSELTQITLPAGAPLAEVYYGYDDQGQVRSVGTTEGGCELGAFTWSVEGKVVRQDYGEQAWTRTATIDSSGRVLGLHGRALAGSDAIDFDMLYDDDGQMHQRSVHFALEQDRSYADVFSYTPGRRLQGASGNSDLRDCSYDANGNLLSASEAEQTTRFDCEPNSNKIETITFPDGSQQSPSYDGRGRMSAALGRTLSYDEVINRTTTVSQGDTCLRFAYGGSQQRVLEQNLGGTQTASFVGAGQVPLALKVGDTWEVSVYGPTGLLAHVSDQTYFPIADTTGSVWAVVTASEVVGTTTYRPFGQLTTTSGTPERIPYRFQGQRWDAAVGLHDFRARMYDPVLRRFLSPDPCQQFASGYLFAANTPLTTTDPSGEKVTLAHVLIGTAMVGLVAASLVLLPESGGSSLFVDEALQAAWVGGGEEAAPLLGGGGGELVSGAGAAAGGGAEAGAEGGSALETAGRKVAASTLRASAVAGFKHTIFNSQDSSFYSTLKAMGMGGLAGLASTGISEALDWALPEPHKLAPGYSGIVMRALRRGLIGGVSNAGGSDLVLLVANPIQHNSLGHGMIKTTEIAGGLGAGFQALVVPLWSSRADLSAMGGGASRRVGAAAGILNNARQQGFSSVVDGFRRAAVAYSGLADAANMDAAYYMGS